MAFKGIFFGKFYKQLLGSSEKIQITTYAARVYFIKQGHAYGITKKRARKSSNMAQL